MDYAALVSSAAAHHEPAAPRHEAWQQQAGRSAGGAVEGESAADAAHSERMSVLARAFTEVRRHPSRSVLNAPARAAVGRDCDAAASADVPAVACMRDERRNKAAIRLTGGAARAAPPRRA